MYAKVESLSSIERENFATNGIELVIVTELEGATSPVDIHSFTF